MATLAPRTATTPAEAPTGGAEADGFVLNATVTEVEATPCLMGCDTSNGCSSTCPSACSSAA